jgi:HAD superfamily hydrolase (TIGR01450 family)
MFATIPDLNAFRVSSASRLSPPHVFKTLSSKFALSFSTTAHDEIGQDNVALQMIQDFKTETEAIEAFYGRSSFPSPTFLKSQKECSDFVHEHIDTVLFDCDGVLYRTTDACPGASETIHRLILSGKKVLFVTNNAGVNRRQLKEKLSKLLNIDSFTNESMVSSSYSCAQYLKDNLKEGSRVHVIGSAGFCEELESSGFRVSGGPSSDIPSMDREELAEYDFDEHPIDAIAVGHDTDFNFRKLTVACNLFLRNPDALFVATNHDSFDIGKAICACSL